MSQPRSPTREQLSRFLPNQEQIRKFEMLFERVDALANSLIVVSALSRTSTSVSGSQFLYSFGDSGDVLAKRSFSPQIQPFTVFPDAQAIVANRTFAASERVYAVFPDSQQLIAMQVFGG